MDSHDRPEGHESIFERADPTDEHGKPVLLGTMMLGLLLVLVVMLVIGVVVLG